MNTRMRKLTALPAAAALMVALAACGDDSGGDDDSSSDETSSAESQDSDATDGSEDASDGTEGSEGADDADAVSPGKPGLHDGVMTGDGYAYEAPDGWDDQTKVAKQTAPTIDTTAARKGDSDGFADNITVVRIDSPPVNTLDELTKTIEQSLGSADFTDLGTTTVGGEEASHISAKPQVPGGTGDYLLERYDILKDGALYGIEFSFSPDVSADERRELVDDVIGSWAWS